MRRDHGGYRLYWGLSGGLEVTKLQCLGIFDVIVSKIALVCLLLFLNRNQSGGGVFKQQIFVVVLCGVEKLEFACISLISTIHVTHCCQNRYDVGDVSIAFSCHHCMRRVGS